MTTPGRASTGQGANSGQDNPLQEDSAGTEAVIIGAPAIPPQVLAVSSEGDLPVWFKPFWENLCSLRDSQAEELANTRRDIANVRLVVDRLSEGQQRVKGVEEGLGGTETRVDELAQESKVQINQLLEVSRRLNEHESQLNQMKIDLSRAFSGRNASQSTGAPPMRARSVGVDDANVQEGVTAAQNQPTSYWPGSQPPPSTLPPLGTVMDGANTVGKPAAAHEETKPVVGNRWSSSVP